MRLRRVFAASDAERGRITHRGRERDEFSGESLIWRSVRGYFCLPLKISGDIARAFVPAVAISIFAITGIFTGGKQALSLQAWYCSVNGRLIFPSAAFPATENFVRTVNCFV